MAVDLTLVWLGLAAFGGSVVQRATGIGFALIAAPLFSLILGPFHGVLLANLISLATNGIVLVFTWPGLDWRKLPLIVVPALVAVLPGAWLAKSMPPSWLSILVGSFVLLAAAAAMRPHRLTRITGKGGLIGAGVASGFMNVTAGIGGPPVAIYAASTKWALLSFVPTMQASNLFVNTASLTSKGWPAAGWVEICAAGIGAVVGTYVGSHLSRRVPENKGFTIALSIASLGGLAAIIRGVGDL